jgi:hypothetical protein
MGLRAPEYDQNGLTVEANGLSCSPVEPEPPPDADDVALPEVPPAEEALLKEELPPPIEEALRASPFNIGSAFSGHIPIQFNDVDFVPGLFIDHEQNLNYHQHFSRLPKPTWPKSSPTIPSSFFRDVNRKVWHVCTFSTISTFSTFCTFSVFIVTFVTLPLQYLKIP